jgi:hypothetical protein
MKTIKVIGSVDEQHRLCAEVPATVPPGPVEVVLVVPSDSEEEISREWTEGIAREWAAEWREPREDIYTIEDGQPVNHAPFNGA